MSIKKSKAIKDKQRISFYLEKDAYKALRENASQLGLSGGLLFRIVLMDYLNKKLKES